MSLEKPKTKLIIYPEGENFNTIPQRWLKENNILRTKLAQMTRIRKNPQWVGNSQNNAREIAWELQQNIQQIIKERRALEKRSDLCQRITRGVRRWLPCGNYSQVDNNKRIARKTRKVSKLRKQIKN